MYRIVEYEPGRYRTERKGWLGWRRLIRCSFVSVKDAEQHIRVYKFELDRRAEKKAFRWRVVKVIDG